MLRITGSGSGACCITVGGFSPGFPIIPDVHLYLVFLFNSRLNSSLILCPIPMLEPWPEFSLIARSAAANIDLSLSGCAESAWWCRFLILAAVHESDLSAACRSKLAASAMVW